ncbi:hypothetical protein [Kineococcus sp. NPDC059986]|uniref:hypothetical protein n=1 Tax=Kineococcus sp. NPDC059986 TaxID=3155538 RepID=UPI003450DDC8
MATARLRLLARAHWVNAWVLHPLARPFARLDGREHPLVWKRVVDLPVEAGPHVLETFVRYRGSASTLGTGRLEFTAAAGETVEVLARNGPLNHQPLQPRRSDREVPHG